MNSTVQIEECEEATSGYKIILRRGDIWIGLSQKVLQTFTETMDTLSIDQPIFLKNRFNLQVGLHLRPEGTISLQLYENKRVNGVLILAPTKCVIYFNQEQWIEVKRQLSSIQQEHEQFKDVVFTRRAMKYIHALKDIVVSKTVECEKGSGM